MAVRKAQPNRIKESVVALAILALDGNQNPLDMAMETIDPDPTSLDIPAEDSQELCSNPYCISPHVHVRIECCP